MKIEWYPKWQQPPYKIFRTTLNRVLRIYQKCSNPYITKNTKILNIALYLELPTLQNKMKIMWHRHTVPRNSVKSLFYVYPLTQHPRSELTFFTFCCIVAIFG